MLCHVFIWWAPLISSAGDGGESDCLWPCYRALEAVMDSRLFVHLLVPYAQSFSLHGFLSKEMSRSVWVSVLRLQILGNILYVSTNTLFC